MDPSDKIFLKIQRKNRTLFKQIIKFTSHLALKNVQFVIESFETNKTKTIIKEDIWNKSNKYSYTLTLYFRIYECSICPKSYYRRYLLTNHLTNTHQYSKTVADFLKPTCYGNKTPRKAKVLFKIKRKALPITANRDT